MNYSQWGNYSNHQLLVLFVQIILVGMDVHDQFNMPALGIVHM